MMIIPRLLATHEYWLRLASAIIYHLPNIYSYILATTKLPDDPGKLYQKLYKNYNNELRYLVKSKILQEHQYKLILPESRKTDICKLDFPTFVLVIQYCTKLKPKGGWTSLRNLKRTDTSKAALLLELEELIKEQIEPIHEIMQERFYDDWEDLICILRNLKMDYKETNYLKSSSLDALDIPEKYVYSIMRAQVDFVCRSQKINELKIYNLQDEDEDNENLLDITNLLNQNQKIRKLIDEINILCDNQKDSDDIKKEAQKLYLKLLDCDKMLNELKNDIEFLHKVIQFEKEPDDQQGAKQANPLTHFEDQGENYSLLTLLTSGVYKKAIHT